MPAQDMAVDPNNKNVDILVEYRYHPYIITKWCPTMSNSKIKLPKKKIAEFCETNHIHKLSLFGSALRDDFSMESDIDFLVEFEEVITPGLIGLSRMERELSETLGGCKVDLRTP